MRSLPVNNDEMRGLIASVKREVTLLRSEINDLRGDFEATSDQLNYASNEVNIVYLQGAVNYDQTRI